MTYKLDLVEEGKVFEADALADVVDDYIQYTYDTLGYQDLLYHIADLWVGDRSVGVEIEYNPKKVRNGEKITGFMFWGTTRVYIKSRDHLLETFATTAAQVG